MRKKIVVLTGAGVSAESGISTFRDSDGLWENFRVEDVASIEGWYRDPAVVMDFYNQRRAQLSEVRPNAAHLAIADLEKELLKLDEPITLCGDGAKVCINNFEELRVDVAEQDVCLPQGDALCCLGLTYKNEATSPENISPAYLRLPQASRELLKKKKEN